MVKKRGRPKTYGPDDEFVSINILTSVRDRLRDEGSIGDTYSDVITKLLDNKK